MNETHPESGHSGHAGVAAGGVPPEASEQRLRKGIVIVVIGLLSWIWTEIRSWLFKRCAWRLHDFMRGGPLRLSMGEWKEFEDARKGVSGLVAEMKGMGLRGLRQSRQIRQAAKRAGTRKPGDIGRRVRTYASTLRMNLRWWWMDVIEEGEDWMKGKRWNREEGEGT